MPTPIRQNTTVDALRPIGGLDRTKANTRRKPETVQVQVSHYGLATKQQ